MKTLTVNEVKVKENLSKEEVHLLEARLADYKLNPISGASLNNVVKRNIKKYDF